MSKTIKLMKGTASVIIKERGSSSCRARWRPTQQGSILMGLIVTMVVMASLGAGMVYLTSTSTFQELFANNHARAYYAAESGGRYASALARQALATNNPVFGTLHSSHLASEFTLTNGDRFQIVNWAPDSSSGSMVVTFDSIGTTGSGFTQARRRLTYRINPANQMGATGGAPPPIPPIVSSFDIPKEQLDTFFSPVEMSEVDIKDNPKVDNDRALNLKAASYTMGLSWFKRLDVAQFDAIRRDNVAAPNTLSYGVQVQIKDIDVDQNNASPYNIIGISFRLDDFATTPGTATLDNMYGISFVKLIKPTAANTLNQAPAWYQNFIHTNAAWDVFSTGSNAGTWFVVLWSRIFNGSAWTYAPLASQKILQGAAVCRAGTANGCTKIKYWSTIMVYVEEISGANKITAYLSQPPTYERSTTDAPTPILWANETTTGSIFTPIDWAGATGATDPITSAEIFQDSSLTTANYDNNLIGDITATKAREIGVHIFNMSTSAQNIFFDNLFIDLTPSGYGGGFIDGSGQVVQGP